MPRGARTDFAVTRHLQSAGFFVHKKSFVGCDGHLYLEGEDKSRVRPKVFKFHKSKCAVCGASVGEEGQGNWHHKGRCDCVECSEVRCDVMIGRPCHAHRTVGFNRDARKQRAKKAFDVLHPPQEKV